MCNRNSKRIRTGQGTGEGAGMYIPSEQELWLEGMTSEQWLAEHDAKIKVYERTRTIDEFLERVLHDNCEGKCPPDVMYCYKCVAMRVAKQMKEGNGNEL